MTPTALLVLMATAGGPDLYPDFGGPPERLLTFDMREIREPAERVLLASAQGLANGQPGGNAKVFLVWDEADAFWRDWLRDRGYVREVSRLDSAAQVVRAAGTARAVLADDGSHHVVNTAGTVAGLERALLVTDERLIDRYGLSVHRDLRDRFRSAEEAYDWLWRSYGARIERRVALVCPPLGSGTGGDRAARLRDLQVAGRLFTFWLEPAEPDNGPDRSEGAEALRRILAREFSPNRVVLGDFGPAARGEEGAQRAVRFLSRLALPWVSVSGFSNLSVWPSFRPSAKRLASPPRPAFVPGRTFAALVATGGEDLGVWRERVPLRWLGEGAPGVPVGWTMGLTLRELAPPLFDWACEHVPPGHSVGGGASGLGAIAGEVYAADRGSPRDRVWQGFLQLTGRALEASGMRWLHVGGRSGLEAAPLPRYASLRMLDAICYGDGPVESDPFAAVDSISGVTVLAFSLGGGKAESLREAIDQVMAREPRPRFLPLPVPLARFGNEDLAGIGEHAARRGISLTTPENLGRLFQQAIGR